MRLLMALAVGLAALWGAQGEGSKTPAWRSASETELKAIIPARAPVGSERIETEFRTASGVTNGKGQFIVGVVLITAGYSADGKYSHFVLTQVPIEVGRFALRPGNYVFGWQREGDGLQVKFYEAQSGKFLGTVEAVRNSTIGRIESFHLYPPSDKAVFQIGRFAFPYKIKG